MHQSKFKRFYIEKALEIIDLETGLVEIGFRRIEELDPSSSRRRYAQEYRDEKSAVLIYSINEDPHQTKIAILNCSEKQEDQERHEYFLPNRVERGRIQAVVLELYMRCFPYSMFPEGLLVGQIYRQHQEDMRDFILEPIHVWVKYQQLRDILNQIETDMGCYSFDIEDHDELLKKNVSVTAQKNELLMVIGGKIHRCPMEGTWRGIRSVPLLDIVLIPHLICERENICISMRKNRIQIGTRSIVT